jgi:hypothetical protein
MKLKPGIYHLTIERTTITEKINYAIMIQNQHYAALIKKGELSHREMKLCGVNFELFKLN